MSLEKGELLFMPVTREEPMYLEDLEISVLHYLTLPTPFSKKSPGNLVCLYVLALTLFTTLK